MAEKIEDCFDGSKSYRYEFSGVWDRETIFKLERLGKLEYFADFPRPFFRVHLSNGGQIWGVEGESSCRALFSKGADDPAKCAFEELWQ